MCINLKYIFSELGLVILINICKKREWKQYCGTDWNLSILSEIKYVVLCSFLSIANSELCLTSTVFFLRNILFIRVYEYKSSVYRCIRFFMDFVQETVEVYLFVVSVVACSVVVFRSDNIQKNTFEYIHIYKNKYKKLNILFLIMKMQSMFLLNCKLVGGSNRQNSRSLWLVTTSWKETIF